MSVVNVGIGEFYVSGKEDEQIRTCALGSCVGILAYNKMRRVAGLLHVALPDSSVNLEKAARLPGYFADTGLPLFLKKMGVVPARRNEFWIKLVGGATIMDENRHFDIGKRNVLSIKKLLWKDRLGAIAEEIGGNGSRTVTITVATGEVLISSGKEKRFL